MKRGVRAAVVLAGLTVLGLVWVTFLDSGAPALPECRSCGSAWWEASPHKGLACGDCHASEGMGRVSRWTDSVLGTTQPIAKPDLVDRGACLSCHQSRGSEAFRAVMETAGHRSHVGKPGALGVPLSAGARAEPGEVDCVDCHGIHETKGRACLDCHPSVRLHEQKMGELECMDCHDFLAPSREDQLRPGAGACRRCHSETAPQHTVDGKVISRTESRTSTPAMAEWLTDENAVPTVSVRVRTSSSTPLPTNGVTSFIPEEWVHGGVDCRMCHNPHEGEAEKRRSGKGCQRCHKKAQLWTEEGKPSEHRRCPSCHAGHAERGFPQKNCERCHTDKQASLHPKSCSNCHRQHVWKASGRDCGSCHADKAIELYETAPMRHDPCTNCHDPHEGHEPEEACAGCHEDKGAAVRRSSAPRHRNCIGCHTPHGPKPGGSEVCHSCHEDQARGALAAATHPPRGVSPAEAPHAKCRECHREIHGSPERDSSVCLPCHKQQFDLARVNKEPPKHQVCTSCHTPHQEKIRPDARACAKCHERQARPDAVGAHKGDCLKCHPPHRFAGDQPTRCSNCHTEIQPKAPLRADKHRDCRNCHLPHRTRAQAKERCVSCHEKPRARLAAWTGIPDHLQCASSCHEGHDVTKLRDCGRCHAKQAAAAMDRKHDECQKCHNPHEMAELGVEPKWRDCSRCHGDKVRATTARGPAHSACRKCHSAHKFQRPLCESCHSAIAEQGMHRVPEHQKCDACHGTHETRAPTRAACVSCHKGHTTHFPDAQRCQACHPFAAGVEPSPGTTPAARPKEDGAQPTEAE
ncbi:MAG: cytochrome c3 family protein [Deltaproteobacteria bacterium]|nr:cytochrome c3 family protein [Deltaproteobacteria bacterium]